MTLYLTNATQKITADVPPVADIQFNGKRYVTSYEEGSPAAFVWNETALGIASDDTAFSFSDGTVMRFAAPIEVASDVTTTATNFTVSGPQSGINTMLVNGNILDFTTGSLAGAEGSTGITLSLTGFGSESEAFNPVISTIQGGSMLYVGRSEDLYRLKVGEGKTETFELDLSRYLADGQEIGSASATAEDGASIEAVYGLNGSIYVTISGDTAGARVPVHFSWSVLNSERSGCFVGHVDVRAC